MAKNKLRKKVVDRRKQYAESAKRHHANMIAKNLQKMEELANILKLHREATASPQMDFYNDLNEEE